METKQPKHTEKEIDDIVHDAKSALATIKLSNEILLQSDELSSETRKTAESNVQEVDRIVKILNKLLP